MNTELKQYACRVDVMRALSILKDFASTARSRPQLVPDDRLLELQHDDHGISLLYQNRELVSLAPEGDLTWTVWVLEELLFSANGRS